MATAARTQEINDDIRDFAKKGQDEAGRAYAGFKSAADDAVGSMQVAFGQGAEGLQAWTKKSVDVARANVNAHLDLLQSLIGARSLAQALEIQASFVKDLMGVYVEQAKDLADLGQKAAASGARPVRDFAQRRAGDAAGR